MQLKIVKFELYPSDEPTGYAVGFNVTSGNNRQFYRDTVVSLEESQEKSDQEIVAIAYEKLKENIESEVIRLESKSSLLGSLWTPVVTIDKTALIDLIPNALTLFDSAIEGEDEGEYVVGSKAIFMEAIVAAETVKDDDAATQEDVNLAVSDLQTSIAIFEENKILGGEL